MYNILEDPTYVSDKRKPRAVKNAYIDIDSVAVQPGHDYCHWIEITKKQLKERENALLAIKIDEMHRTISGAFGDLNLRCVFTIPDKIPTDTFQYLHNKIDEWDGVKLLQTKSALNEYRQYFNIAKNWWDQTKKKVFGAVFWVNVFKYLQKFICNTFNIVDVNRFKYIMLNVVRALFNGTVKYNNTKTTRLINGGTFVCSHEMQQYLLCLNDSIQIVDTKLKNAEIMHRVRLLLDAAVEPMNQMTAMNMNTNGDHDDDENKGATDDQDMSFEASLNVQSIANPDVGLFENQSYTIQNDQNTQPMQIMVEIQCACGKKTMNCIQLPFNAHNYSNCTILFNNNVTNDGNRCHGAPYIAPDPSCSNNGNAYHF